MRMSIRRIPLADLLTLDDLHSEQKQAIRDILQYKCFCLSSSMGMGKTAIVLHVVAILQKKQKASLIVAESSAVGETWAKEHLHWEFTRDLDVCVLKGTPKQRLKMLQEKHDAYVISYNSVEWLLKHTDLLPHFHAVFCDEANKIKGETSKFRKAIMGFSTDAEIRIAVTGTPRAKDEKDFFGILQFVDNGQTLGSWSSDSQGNPVFSTNWTAFKEHYMKDLPLPNGTRLPVFKNKAAAREVRDKSMPFFRNYAMSEKAKVPIVKRLVHFNLTTHARRLYDEFTEIGMGALENYVELTNEELKPSAKLQILNKLSLLSSGFVYRMLSPKLDFKDLMKYSAKQMLAMREREVLELFNDRIVALNRLMAHIRKEHEGGVVICYNAKHELTQLKSAYPDALYDTQKNFVDEWNTGKHNVLLLQYNRSSKSLNLQRGGHVVVFYSLVFNFVDAFQIVRRVARQGQKAPQVYLYILIATDTRDEDKYERITDREEEHHQFAKETLIG